MMSVLVIQYPASSLYKGIFNMPDIVQERLNRYRWSLALLLVLFVVVEGALIIGTRGLTRPPWGDESHFVETVRAFGNDMGLDNIRNYRQVTPPLTFIAYALWGHIAGFDLPHLRLLSLMVAFVFYILIHRIVFETTGKGVLALFVTALLMVNPYMAGVSVFVFTDMITLAFIAASLYAVWRERPLLLWFGLAGALLCRQYSVFLMCGACLYAIITWYFDRRPVMAAMAITSFLSIVPLGMLFLLWGGVAPPVGSAYWNPESDLRFHPGFVSVYLVMTTVYLAPLLAYSWRRLYADRRTLLMSAVAGFYYAAFPIRASEVTVMQTGRTTVGLCHRLIRTTGIGSVAEDVLFMILFMLAMPVVIHVVRIIRSGLKTKILRYDFFLGLLLFCFLIIMPFSYQNWEKYILPLLPVITLLLISTEETATIA